MTTRSHRGRCLAAGLAALLLAAALPSAAGARPFSDNAFWNRPLASNAPLASDGAALNAELQRQVAAYTPWLNTTSYSTPVYKVTRSQPTVKVTLDGTYPTLVSAFQAVPIPATAKAAAGWDAHMVIWQTDTDTMWEFWRATKQADGWHAGWGGKMTSVSTSSGVFPSPLGATASGLPLLGGLIRPFELSAGSIPHALALALPDVRATVFTAPATRTDGTITTLQSIPEGTRFRLPADLDISALGLSPAVRAMAVAAQRYGIVVRDRSFGSLSFYAEDPTPTGTNPYPTLFGTAWYDKPLRTFPWSKLQALAPTT